MNQDKIDYYNYLSRKQDINAINRIAATNDTEHTRLEERCKNMNFTIKLSELADDSLHTIRDTLLTRLSSHNIESFTIKSEIKKIDRVLKLRKTPLIDD